ncbi:Transcriptional regulatory protein KdpE [Neobacillus rhizosphaerae]|uniref:Transcriptional regulatory protein KdpE n=1 Tax=Neobacillus rhizosphaerae TaxID=2880965 RepID=A0ABM9EN72_9BACI|nr:response regulator transcription factor [Neobacillus rhizosphaerae]CAH2714051.1 Transcriptional regulatory protein KdpE [Neobacillus rhizosphaerae]
MLKQKIVIVDDEPKIIRLVSANLRTQNYEVVTYTNGHEMLENYDRIMPDLVLLDILMPEIDGFKVLEALRSFSTVPVIMLSACHDASDKVTALDLGSDDYMTKPFTLEELYARIRAVLRRTGAQQPPAEIATSSTIINLQIDYAKLRISVDGRKADVSNTEYKLFAYLATNRGKVLTHEELLKQIWGPEYRNDIDYLRVTIARLRQKLRKANGENKIEYIITYPGVGYMIE